MSNIPTEDQLLQKQNTALQFPLEDVTVLQNRSETTSRFNWKELKSLRSALKLGQIISAIVILVMAQLRHMRLPWMQFYALVTFSALTATIALLGDSLLTAHPLRRAFTPAVWFRMELWFTGLAALVYYLLTFCILSWTIRYDGLNIYCIALAFGFISAGLYVVDWWRNFSKRTQVVQQI